MTARKKDSTRKLLGSLVKDAVEECLKNSDVEKLINQAIIEGIRTRAEITIALSPIIENKFTQLIRSDRYKFFLTRFIISTLHSMNCQSPNPGEYSAKLSYQPVDFNLTSERWRGGLSWLESEDKCLSHNFKNFCEIAARAHRRTEHAIYSRLSTTVLK